MIRNMPRIQVAIAALGLTPLLLSAAHADVVMQERISVEGTGLMSMANMSGTSTTSIAGKRSRIESDLQMQSRLVRMFARGAGQSTEIVRLDDEKVFELDPNKKQYKETSLAERRAQLEKAQQQMQEAREKQPAPTGLDESQCDWSEPQADVKKTGATANIAGLAAEQVTVIAKQSCKDRKTGAVCDVAVTLDQWLAPAFDAGEVLDFHRAYAQQLGISTDGRDVTERAEALLGRYKGMWSQVAEKMRDMKGYPVKTSFAFGMGGPQCHDPNAAGGATSESSSSGPQSPAAIAGQIAGSIFGRKKKAASSEASETPAAQPAGMEGMVTPLRISSDLVSVSRGAVPASAFEVPADFKKTP